MPRHNCRSTASGSTCARETTKSEHDLGHGHANAIVAYVRAKLDG
jgi:hypothetical protein